MDATPEPMIRLEGVGKRSRVTDDSALFFQQRLNLNKILGILLVIGGVVGLQLSGAA